MTELAPLPFGWSNDIAAALPAVVKQLRSQRVIAYPTETVYGFGSSLMHDAMTRVGRLKGTTPERTFIALIAERSMLDALDIDLSGAADALATQFWPGPLTLLVRNKRGAKTGVRWTPHPGAQSIIRAFGEPITSTSANRTGLPPAATAAEIVKEWERDVRDGTLLVLDGGGPMQGASSTIIDCGDDVPRIVRRGAVDVDALRAIVPALADEVP